jgi:hypothetical protein
MFPRSLRTLYAAAQRAANGVEEVSDERRADD